MRQQRAAREWRRYPIGLLRSLSAPGIFAGVLFFAFSLAPSLLPRPFPFQAAVSGISLTLGYALGCAARSLWAYLELPLPGARWERALKIAAATVALAVTAAFIWHASEWQNSVRALMGLEEVSGIRLMSVALIALLVFAVLLALGRLFRRTFQFLARKLRRVLPRRVSNVVGVIAAVYLFWGIIDGLIVTRVLEMADGISQQVDAVIQDELERPRDPAKTGSADSLIPWRDLGHQGRQFVSSGPTAAELRAFHGQPAPEPVRVYVGLSAAGTPQARARLALRELERVGAFERRVLLLVTPTGTGWIDPAALDAVEYLTRGEIATVALQYSYLPSVLALTVEGDYGAESARALFEAVYGHWTRLPKPARPALYLHGVSLGALNSERSFHLHDILADPFQGALWSGPPFRSAGWNNAVANRDPGSPPWLPRFRDGAVVRFMNQNGGLEAPGAGWGPLRIAYLQYASDPMTFFNPRSLYREPEWMREPRPPDVSPHLRWFPVVTMVQLAADMAVANTPPPGYGHDFAAEHYVDAWRALMEPEGWSEDDIARLKLLLARRQAARAPRGIPRP